MVGGGGGGGPGGHARDRGGAVRGEAPLYGPRRASGRLAGGPGLGLHLRLDEVMEGGGREGGRERLFTYLSITQERWGYFPCFKFLKRPQ